MLSVVIICLAVLCSVLRCIPRRGKWAAGVAVATGVICLCGIPLVGIAWHRAQEIAVSALPEAEWAYDMLRGWFSLAGGFTAIVGICLLIASLIRHKMVWMRTLIAPCAVIALQIGGAGYAVLCENAVLDLSGIVTLFGAGCGAWLLCGTAADAIRYAISGQPSLSVKKTAPPSRRRKRR